MCSYSTYSTRTPHLGSFLLISKTLQSSELICLKAVSGDEKANRVKHIQSSATATTAVHHYSTRASYVYSGCLAWYNVVLTHGSTQA